MARSVLILALLLAGRSAAEEWSRPYEGFLPGTEPDHVSATLVRDARTLVPLAGVTVRQYAEDAGDDFVAARLLGEAVSDEFGVVELAWNEEPFDCHWVFDLPGYAVVEEYGGTAGSVVDLARGRAVGCRLLDPTGRARAGAGVEVFLGCGHSPAVRYATTGEDGRFVLHDLDPRTAILWFLEPGLQSRYWDLGDGSELTLQWFARPGCVLDGVVVDGRGFPVAGAVVRSHQQFRGPTAVTDARGRFRLIGWDPHETIAVHGPGAVGSAWLGRGELDPDRTVRIVLKGDPGADGRRDREEDDVEIAIRVIDEQSGNAVPGVELALLRPEDGRLFCGTTGDGETDPLGTAIIEAPAGTHTLRVGDVFSSHVAAPGPCEVRDDDSDGIVVRARRQPQLLIEGAAPVDAGIELIAGTSILELRGPDSPEVFLPEQGEAVLRVEAEGLVRLFEVGPVHEGRRNARIDWPERKRILLEIPEGCTALLRDAWCTTPEEGVLETHATGRQLLAVTDGESGLGTQEIEIVLPEEPGAVLDLGRLPLHAPGELSILLPDGNRDGDAEVVVWDGVREAKPERDESWHFREGAFVRAAREGFVTLRRLLRGPGPYALHWGEASLEIGCNADRFVFYLDGELVPATGGRLRLEGLENGPHLVIVGAKQHVGQAMRLELGAGEHRVLDVELERR